MRKVLIFLTLFPVVFFPKSAFAHLPGQPAFFRVNGQYAKLYPVLSTSLNDFSLPQDITTQNTFLVNSKIYFDIDTSKLPVPKSIINQSKFMWDFGDGQKDLGLATSHSYSRIGSYIIKLTVDDGTSPQPLLLDSVFMNITPNNRYNLPQSVIQVEGTKSKDPIIDILTFSFDKELQFDSSFSQVKPGKNVSYFWDFGDGQTSTEKNPTHRYKKDFRMVFPLLRIKDENGFISDSFAQIDNASFFPLQKITKPKTQITSQDQNNGKSTVSPLLIGVFFLGVFSLFLLFFKKRKKS